MAEEISILNVLATLVPILATLGGITYWLGRRFAEIDEKFDALKSYVDERFDDLKAYIDRRITRLG